MKYMSNVFIYQDPHPAHKQLADFLRCKYVKNNRKGLTKTPSVGRLLQARRVQSALKKLSPTIILTENVSTDLLAGALYKKKYKKTKLISIVADPKMYEFSNAPIWDKKLTLFSLRSADILLVGSEMMMQLLPEEVQHKARSWHPPIMDIKKHLALNAKFNKNFVFVGRLDDYKGLDILYSIFTQQQEIWPHTTLFIAGDGHYKSILADGYLKNIKYLGKTNDSLFMSKEAAFYLAPARCEPSGVAIAEAMAQGIVPIVSRGVGYKELVKKVDPKLVVNTPKEAIDIINRLFLDKHEWKRLSVKCKKTASQLTEENSIRMFEDAIKTVI